LKSHIISHEKLEQLAQRMNAEVDWNELNLPPKQISLLHQITDHLKQNHRIRDHVKHHHPKNEHAMHSHRIMEGFDVPDHLKKGEGVCALFSGKNGSGKMLAAQVIANELNLDLFRIDLSTVVGKFIGATEKNLDRIFDAADECGSILIFDEVTALFGRRSSIHDVRDRYANTSITHLLQRIESYHGLVIIMTKSKDSLGHIFKKRIQFFVKFPVPGRVLGKILGNKFSMK
jgi:AAA+ superfamily predicted ATPase